LRYLFQPTQALEAFQLEAAGQRLLGRGCRTVQRSRVCTCAHAGAAAPLHAVAVTVTIAAHMPLLSPLLLPPVVVSARGVGPQNQMSRQMAGPGSSSGGPLHQGQPTEWSFWSNFWVSAPKLLAGSGTFGHPKGRAGKPCAPAHPRCWPWLGQDSKAPFPFPLAWRV
jgi:hypothetical protein